MPDDFHSGEDNRVDREQSKLSRQNIILRIALLQANLEALNQDLTKKLKSHNPGENQNERND